MSRSGHSGDVAFHRIGVATCMAHHGEILQGVFSDAPGSLRRGLVTLPWAQRSVTAEFRPAMGPDIRVNPLARSTAKALRAARLTLDDLQNPEIGGELILTGDIPVGKGCGSSTCDVVATIRAVADACQSVLTCEHIALLAVASEGAVDATMFAEAAILFGHRDGSVIEAFSRPLPPLEVLGFDTADEHRGVDTLRLEGSSYSVAEIDLFAALRVQLREAIETGDPHSVGSTASASAEVNQRFLPKPHFAQLQTICRESGAVGLQVAHSGTVAGFLFDVSDRRREKGIARATEALGRLSIESCWRFTTPSGFRPLPHPAANSR
jgi:uncharacterized protein involved in propanediol utilization